MRDQAAAKEKRSAFAVPQGVRVYAFGDIHGRFDLLRPLYEAVEADLAARPVGRSVEIFLGDYVDRGPASRQVLEFLAAGEPVCDERLCLKGNHEAMFLQVLEEPELLPYWMSQGGAATILSFGVATPRDARRETLLACRDALTEAIGPGLRAFVENLSLMERIGDYLFVHAGIDPARPLTAQREEDLVWIREPFLSSEADFGVCVVHGHTPVRQVEARANRIDIDTGAFATDILSCLVLEGRSRRLLATKGG
ncbi:metallophosphoesterase family protein [Afifella pfennigii]|uniref:metallophosphoesterase family protein n=1 Tax=Afifella pfennigii TaxID=209897 RepID=UPI00068AFDD2|nr:metallophosphoesterase family protein [Afifella pfennigii]